jgi:hypothetical protein
MTGEAKLLIEETIVQLPRLCGAGINNHVDRLDLIGEI